MIEPVHAVPGAAPTAAAPGLHLFTSNRMETLAQHLADRLRTPLLSPLAEEIVVVRNQGMERWLRLELARQLGISARFRFEFPEEFIRALLQQALPDAAAANPLQRDVLAWRIAAVLPELQRQPAFTPVRHYLEGGDERKLLQLAGRLANLFDQYQVFRPELVLDWDAGKAGRDPAAAWQAELWRAVTGHARGLHPAALARRFADALGQPRTEGLPERVAIFGVSALPPFHLDMMSALAQRVQVNFFLLQPSREYWGDITSPREQDRIRRRTLRAEEAAFDLHLESGNRLLASLGYLGRDFLKLLLGAGDWVAMESFTEPGEETLLQAVQADLLHLRDRGAPGAEVPRRAVGKADDSIRVHVCHSPLREMEVLQNHLLDWLAKDRSLQPRDIVVMMPDVATYAPFVQAVFGSPESEALRLPFSVADRGAREASHVVSTFLDLLALPATRLGAATLLAPLDTAAVRGKFDLSEREVEVVRDWVRDLNIRWGIDAGHRAELDLPEVDAHAWRPGLERLLLGYAMAAGDLRLFEGRLPFDDVEGDAAELAGRLVEYTERAFALVRRLGEARPLAAWVDLLEGVVGDFFTATEEAERELQLLRAALADLREQAALAGFDRPLGLDALRERLEPALAEDLQQGGFLRDGITFCGLKPMRSIPFKVVCLVGMNDGAFPRPTQQASFDLMARQPRLGDRSTREDDRYLFLETLLSARGRLYLSHVGRGIRDNRESPPSVLISELLDYLDQGFYLEDTDAAAIDGPLRRHLVVVHPLQAFHPGYFNGGDERLFSYSQANCQASGSAAGPRPAPAGFLPQPLAEPGPSARTVDLAELARFFANPAGAFLRQRLQVVPPETVEGLPEREPFALDALGQFRLCQELVARGGTAEARARVRAAAVAAGDLPPGTAGELDFAGAGAEAAAFAARLDGVRPAVPPPALDLDLALAPFRVTGRLAQFTHEGPLLYRCAKLRARDLIEAWLHHLGAGCARPGVVTTLLTRDTTSRFRPVPDPAGILRGLLDLYWEGMGRPLRFFPRTALAFMEAERAGNSGPLDKALATWEGGGYGAGPGEKEDLACDFCFRHELPLNEEFERHARAVLGPLLDHETRTEP